MTGDQLKQWRNKLGWRPEAAAAFLGVSARTYAKYEALRKKDDVPLVVEVATRVPRYEATLKRLRGCLEAIRDRQVGDPAAAAAEVLSGGAG